MKIIITNSFQKYLKKYNISENTLVYEISKYEKGISFIDMGIWKGYILYKDYLDKKKKRIITLVKKGKYYIPIVIVKKESKLGKNLYKDTIIKDFEKDIKKSLFDIDNNNIYIVIQL